MTARRATLDLDHDRPRPADPATPKADRENAAPTASPLVKGAVLIGVGAVVGVGAWWLVRNKLSLLRRLL